ncbi:hypothetical protein T06_16339 [Trichinella sp. T6]|nr:hypothetical protein T06_16339 [Trichinella sp. T6]
MLKFFVNTKKFYRLLRVDLIVHPEIYNLTLNKISTYTVNYCRATSTSTKLRCLAYCSCYTVSLSTVTH